MQEWATKVVAAIDVRDVVLFVALVLLATGFWMIWIPLAFIVPGSIVAAVAVFGAPGANNAGE